jgi:hypothetical protein
MVGPHHLLKKAFCCRYIAFRSKHELYSITSRVYCTIEIFTALSDFDVSLVNSI